MLPPAFRIVLAALLASTLAAVAQAPATPAPAVPPPPPAQVSMQVDLAKSLGPYRPISSFFGYDEINFTTGKYGRQLLPELHDLSPAPVYIRAHHLLTSGDGQPKLKWSSTNVFSLDANGKPVYDFTVLDQIFDEYKAAGVRPMVELGFMPKDLASGKMNYEYPYPNTVRGSLQSPPKDYAMWGELVRTVVAHFVQRYGAPAVASWYFEVWNEPDINYWQGTQADYFKLYDYSVAGVRKALPTARVGGPGSTGPGSQKAIGFLTNFLKHCATEKSAATGGPIPLDFVSFHPKGSPRLVPPAPGETAHIRMGIQNEISAAANGFRTVAASARYHNIPIILSEADPEGCAACSARENPNNAYRNSPVYPTYTAAVMKAFLDLAAENKVNLVGMVTWAFEFEGKDYFEGFRTLSTNGIDQPVLNIFRMAGLLSGSRVAATSTSEVRAEDIVKSGVRQQPDIDAFATKSTHEAAVMLWNYHDEDLPVAATQVTVKITGIPVGVHKVLVTHYRIDDTHSNAYTVWQAMGSPQSPTPEQYAQLQAAGQLQLLTSPAWLDVTNGSLTLPTTLPREATSLLHLEW